VQQQTIATMSTLPRVIGLSGKKRHGKDTLGWQLGLLGYQRLAFADALYDEVAADTGVPVAELQRADCKEKPRPELGGLSPRVFLQEYGMRRREADEDYWVRQVARVVQTNRSLRFVITDVRLPNEARFVEEHGVLVRVLRPLAAARDMHISETALDNWPFVFTVTNEEGCADAMLVRLLEQFVYGVLSPHPALTGGQLEG
jgi:hypothetical protein